MLFLKKKNSAYKTRTGQSISCPVFGEGLEVFEHEANSCSYSEDFKDTGFKKYVRRKQSLTDECILFCDLSLQDIT